MMINKAMVKSLLMIVIALVFSFNLQAQKTNSKSNTKPKPYVYQQGFRIGFGLNVGPVFNKPYTFGLGIDGRLQYDLSKRYSFTLTTGFTNLFTNSGVDNLGFIPLKAGFKGFIWNDQFYIMGEFGPGFAVTNQYNQTALIISPSIGFATKYIDLSVRLDRFSNFPTINNNKGAAQLALRLAYGFSLK